MNYIVSDSNIHIEDSYTCIKKAFEPTLQGIKALYPSNRVLNSRKMFSLKMEWATHNFLYSLGLWKERTKDVDLDYPCDKKEWIYCTVGILIWLFIK